MKITWTIVALAGSTGMVSAQSAPRVPPVPPPAPSPIAATLPRPAEPAVAPAPAETWTSLPGAVAVPWIDITASIAPIAVPIDPLTATLGEGSVVWALQQGQGPVVARPPRPPRPVDADVERLLSQLEREEAARQRAIDAQQRALERELAAEERARQREMEQIGQAARREIETRERAAQREAEQAARVLERELEDQRQAEYTQIIIGEADRLRTLVDRMLGPRVPATTSAGQLGTGRRRKNCSSSNWRSSELTVSRSLARSSRRSSRMLATDSRSFIWP